LFEDEQNEKEAILGRERKRKIPEIQALQTKAPGIQLLVVGLPLPSFLVYQSLQAQKAVETKGTNRIKAARTSAHEACSVQIRHRDARSPLISFNKT
jgi:hypothetical protein